MKIFKLSQRINNGYDTYDSCVVVAKDENEARLIRPDGNDWKADYYNSWANMPEEVIVEEIGTTRKQFEYPIICASFNPG